MKGARVDITRLRLVFDLYKTTSPSSLIYGSIDGSRRFLALRGYELWNRTLGLARRLREAVVTIPGMSPLGEEVLLRPGASALDETKVVIEVRGLGITGVEAGDWLEEHCHIAVELADQRRIMVLLTVADSDESVDRLIAALRERSAWEGHARPNTVMALPTMAELETELVVLPREAYLGPVRQVPLCEAPGEVAAEMISPYPPGIPAIVPGERFTQPIVDLLRTIHEIGIAIPDSADPYLRTVRVVA